MTGLQEHCDLLPNSACKAMDAGDRSFPDGWLEETLEVALHGCHKAPCFALDIGANIGLVALRMMQAGAHVVAIEPQTDLCCAGSLSAAMNGFGQRALHLCAGLAVPSKETVRGTLHVGDNYRYGNFGHEAHFRKYNLTRTVPLLSAATVALAGPAEARKFAFIKIDTDAVDLPLLRFFADQQRAGALAFESVALEVWSAWPSAKFARLMADLQADGYSIYRTPAAYSRSACASIQHTFPELIDLVVSLRTCTLLRIRNMSYAEWSAAPTGWHTENQMLVTRLPVLERGRNLFHPPPA